MLHNLKELHGFAIGALDGDIGHVKDLYLDDQGWVVRYLVVETGGWLSKRKVLISPMAIGDPDWTNRRLPVLITKEKVKNSPDFDTEQPVTRQHEMDNLRYYGYPYYWGGTGYWGAAMYPSRMGPYLGGAGTVPTIDQAIQNAEANRSALEDPHLRSCNAITSYHIHAGDEEIGHVCGMLIDDETWAVRYLIIDTSNWWLGHQMLVVPQWIESVSWEERTVSVKLTRQAMQDAPTYDPAAMLTRGDEALLHNHYGRSGYWAASEKRDTKITRI